MPLGNPNFYFDGVNLTKIHATRFYYDRQDCNRNWISIFGRHTFYGILTRHTFTSKDTDFTSMGFYGDRIYLKTTFGCDQFPLWKDQFRWNFIKWYFLVYVLIIWKTLFTHLYPRINLDTPILRQAHNII